ncbi:MAG: hypothetical protein HXX11_22630 [Desulfuromonadales bacterium]|nr:hypothetical protein [Desulfuromonadales bacterium]
MTTLIPSITTCKFDSSVEGRFARLLEAKLEDDYLCWYNVPIGPGRLHPDFIILHPQRGLRGASGGSGVRFGFRTFYQIHKDGVSIPFKF